MRFKSVQRRSTSEKLPSVTVIVPCYNYGRFLPECVNSVLYQPEVDVSIHILDDASTDGSYSVAESLAEGHPNIRTTKNATNIGHIATYNRGLAQVASDYVVLLSADDLLAPGALRRATDLMEANPNVGLVYGHPQTFETAPLQSAGRVLCWSVWRGEKWIQAQFRRGLSIIHSPEAVVRTSVQHRVGAYRADLPHSADLEMWLRIAAVSDVGRVNGPDQAYRRVHAASMMNSRFKGVLTDLRERQRAYEAFLNAPGLDPARKEKLEALMRRRLAGEALGWATDEMNAGAWDGGSDAAKYAKEVDPHFRRLPAWREFEAAARQGQIQKGNFDHFRRSIEDRLRWQLWRRFGV